MGSKAYIKNQNNFKDHRDFLLSELVWSTPKRKANNMGQKSDVITTITKTKGSKTGKSFNIIFHNEVEKLIDEGGLCRMGICRCKNRLFFKSIEDGYKICSSEKYHKAVVKIFYEQGDEVYVGNYDLKYDDFLELYYIEVEAKHE